MISKLRMPAEELHAGELRALVATDTGHRPPGWALSPRQVITYLMGGTATDGTAITPKYVGDKRLIETAVATLATDQALLLLGLPGTAKSWVSEHLAAAITGDSKLVIQGTAGTDENQIRYGWNYAQLLAHGPRREALVPTPLMRAMEAGMLCRFEELTPHGQRRAGHPHHRALRKDDADPGTQQRGLCRARFQHHRHRQQPRQGCERDVVRVEAPLQRGGAAAARRTRAGSGHRHQARQRDDAESRPAGAEERRGGSALAWSRFSASCARA